MGAGVGTGVTATVGFGVGAAAFGVGEGAVAGVTVLARAGGVGVFVAMIGPTVVAGVSAASAGGRVASPPTAVGVAVSASSAGPVSQAIVAAANRPMSAIAASAVTPFKFSPWRVGQENASVRTLGVAQLVVDFLDGADGDGAGVLAASTRPAVERAEVRVPFGFRA